MNLIACTDISKVLMWNEFQRGGNEDIRWSLSIWLTNNEVLYYICKWVIKLSVTCEDRHIEDFGIR